MIGKDLHFEKRLLLARDEGMKGNFFPSKANFDPKVYRLKEEKPLYWSSEIIEKDAFSQSQSNQITVFPVGTNYQVLSRNNKWLYVQILDAPPIVPSRVINPSNLQETRLIGWFYFP